MPAPWTAGPSGDPESFPFLPGASPQHMELARRKSGILLLTLVSFLIVTLFIVVQLFIMKLRKAHVIWKKGEWAGGPGAATG